MPESSVEGWLTQLGLGRYTSLFHENQVKAGDLIRLNDDYLKEIGVHSAKHRNQMLAAPKPIIQAKPKNTARSKADLQTSLQILWLYFFSPLLYGPLLFHRRSELYRGGPSFDPKRDCIWHHFLPGLFHCAVLFVSHSAQFENQTNVSTRLGFSRFDVRRVRVAPVRDFNRVFTSRTPTAQAWRCPGWSSWVCP